MALLHCTLRKELAVIPLRQFHVEWDFSGGLHICQYEIYLSALPCSDDCQREEEVDGLPCYDWSIGFPVIDTPLLLPTTYVESCLPVVDFACVDLSLVSHSPHHVQYSHPFWHFFYYLPVFVSYVILQLLVHGPFELVSIGHLHCFMKVHDVWVCTRCICHRLLHIFLYLILPLGCWYVFCFILTDEDFHVTIPCSCCSNPSM